MNKASRILKRTVESHMINNLFDKKKLTYLDEILVQFNQVLLFRIQNDELLMGRTFDENNNKEKKTYNNLEVLQFLQLKKNNQAQSLRCLQYNKFQRFKFIFVNMEKINVNGDTGIQMCQMVYSFVKSLKNLKNQVIQNNVKTKEELDMILQGTELDDFFIQEEIQGNEGKKQHENIQISLQDEINYIIYKILDIALLIVGGLGEEQKKQIGEFFFNMI